MSMTPEYQAALDALTKAADTMTRACNEYNLALRQGAEIDHAELEKLKAACEKARDAHDEALADAWELIEQQP